MAKSDLVQHLLSHPDETERALALTLAGVEARHVEQASKDPHPLVQAAAARWRARNALPEPVGNFRVTRGVRGGNQYLFFHPTHEQLATMGSHSADVSKYAQELHGHFQHHAPDVLAYARFTGEPGGQLVLHEVHAPWHASPALRGVAAGSWANNTFGAGHDLHQVEGVGQARISDLAHHGVETHVFQGKDPEQAVRDAFEEYAKGKGSSVHQELRKSSVGYVKFPKLGVDQVPTQPYVAPDEGAYANKRRAARNLISGSGVHPASKAPPGWGSADTADAGEYGAGFQLSGSRLGHYQNFAAVIPGAVHSTHGASAHEAQHTVFGALASKYGYRARRGVSLHLLGKLSDGERNTLGRMMSVSGYEWLRDPEEGVACHQNYLQDPKFRAHVHSTLGLNPLQARVMHDTMKHTWRKLRSHAALLTPEQLTNMGL